MLKYAQKLNAVLNYGVTNKKSKICSILNTTFDFGSIHHNSTHV